MKKKIASVTALIMLLFTTFTGVAQNPPLPATVSKANIEVIQFHSEHRCMTCNKIEELTKETLKNYSSISFTLVNVDDKKNSKLTEQFEATGTALFLYNQKTGKKKDLTDFAFMNARDKDKFILELKKHIEHFLNN